MTVPVWPEDLPQLMLMEGFSFSVRDGRLSTKTDTGPGKVRRRSTAVGKQVAGSIELTLDQKEAFESFWEDDLKDGVLPFWLPDQFKSGADLLTDAGEPLLTDDGESILIEAWSLVRFTGEAPGGSAVDRDTYRLNASVLVLR